MNIICLCTLILTCLIDCQIYKVHHKIGQTYRWKPHDVCSINSCRIYYLFSNRCTACIQQICYLFGRGFYSPKAGTSLRQRMLVCSLIYGNTYRIYLDALFGSYQNLIKDWSLQIVEIVSTPWQTLWRNLFQAILTTSWLPRCKLYPATEAKIKGRKFSISNQKWNFGLAKGET